MKSIASLILATTIVALACIAPGVAAAEEGGNPLVLPEPTAIAPLTFTTATTATVSIENATTGLLECTSGSSKGEFTSKRLGVITMDFKGCAWKNLKCTSKGSPAGVIVFSNAKLHLVALKVAGVLRAALVITLPSAIPIEGCWLGAEFRGSLIGLIDGVTSGTETKLFTLLFHRSLAKQELKECDLDKEFCLTGEVHKKFLLETFVGSGFVEMGVERQDSVALEKTASFDF
jgi:hypothetical protein